MKKIFILIVGILMFSVINAETIYEIQYTEDASGDSPFKNEIVTVTGIVTAIGYNFSNDNFFISEDEGGEWNGIYIYGAGIEPNLGDEVEITGRVVEYQGITEITIISIANIISSDNPLPEATIISTNELATEEKYESVLVQIQNITVTEGTNDDGEWYVNDGSGECQIDDNIFSATIIANSEIESITGIVDEHMSEFALIPRDENDIFGYEEPEDSYDLIADIQNNFNDYDGDEVTVCGVVTIGDNLLYPGQTKFYIQDESGHGIQVYNSQPLSTIYVRGDKIEVTGTIERYNDDVEITYPTITLISQNESLPFAHNLAGNEDETWNGTWSKAVGTITDVWDSEYGFYKIEVDTNGGIIDLMFWKSAVAPDSISHFMIGDLVCGKGVITFYEGAPQLSCGYAEDVTYDDGISYSYGEISELIPNQPTEITFNYSLEYESVILHWKTISFQNFSVLEMEKDSTFYFTNVPAQDEGTTVEFYIVATDTSNIEHTFPEGYPNESAFSFTFNITSHAAALNMPAKVFNPFLGETFPIDFGSENGDKAILRIYNAEGKLKTTLKNEIISNSNGIVHLDWNGRDKNYELLPIGLYICYLEVIDVNTGAKKTAKAPIVIGTQLK